MKIKKKVFAASLAAAMALNAVCVSSFFGGVSAAGETKYEFESGKITGTSMKEEDVEEERRLFYVGVTRAKKYLHILSVKKLYNKDSRPSRFVEELRSRQEKRGVLHGK